MTWTSSAIVICRKAPATLNKMRKGVNMPFHSMAEAVQIVQNGAAFAVIGVTATGAYVADKLSKRRTAK